MAKYFLHLYDGDSWSEDEEGFEAGSLGSAIVEAKRLIAGIIRDQIAEGREPGGQFAELRDENDQLVSVITFRDVHYGGYGL